MPKKDEIKDFYFNTREVAESLEPGITDEVEKEFGVDGTPDETDNGSYFAAAAYGLSSLLADSFHERTDKVFYDNKSDDFEEFAIELHQNKSKANFNSKRYITIGRTYSEIANDVEGVKSDYPNGFDLMQKKTGKQKEKVFEMMEEFAEDLTNRSSTLDRPGPVS